MNSLRNASLLKYTPFHVSYTIYTHTVFPQKNLENKNYYANVLAMQKNAVFQLTNNNCNVAHYN